MHDKNLNNRYAWHKSKYIRHAWHEPIIDMHDESEYTRHAWHESI
jgi:hypothetical protein